MSRKGGYKIIDLKNKPLTIAGGRVYDGIYEEIENTTKRIVLSGLNVEGSEFKDISLYFELVGSSYQAKLPLSEETSFSTITINDNDVVTII